MPELYDRIGVGYRNHRQPDPRIAGRIESALGGARTVLNVGAGTGSYEPSDRRVVAVEPSMEMIGQRRADAPPAVRAVGTALPFPADAFDATLAILTIHHWPDRPRGLEELARVARDRVVILTFDPAVKGFWLVDDYFPEIAEVDRHMLSSIGQIRSLSPDTEIHTVPVPHDCTDGFLGAYWRRPEAYLDSGVRGAISGFSMIGDLGPRLERLRRDLEDGSWERRHGHVLAESELDLGYRLAVVHVGAEAERGRG